MSKKFDVVSIGSTLRDIFLLNNDLSCVGHKLCHPFNPEVVGEKIKVKKMYFDIGGGGSNTAATFANMGLKTSLFSQIGDDMAGKEALKVLKKFKVDTSLIKIQKGEETGYSVIFIDKDGDRTALVYRGASGFDDKTSLPKSKMKTDWFFITSLGGNMKLLKDIFTFAKKNKIRIAWNPGDGELRLGSEKLMNFLRGTNVLFLNFTEAQRLAKSHSKDISLLAGKMAHITKGSIICITNGKDGSFVKRGKEEWQAEIIDKKVLNTTGAGDAFGSGFLSGLIIYENDIKKALQLATLNSNNVVQEMGGKHGILRKRPTEKELNKVKIIEPGL